MHIGFFSGDITRLGGTENVSCLIANALVERTKYIISVISIFEEHEQPFFDIDDRINRFALYPTVIHGVWHYFDTCKRLRRVVCEQHIDVLIDIDGILDMYSLPVKHNTGVKVISWEHFNYLQNPDVPYRKLTRRWAARSADAIVTLTETDKQLYQSNLNLRCPIMAIANPMVTLEEQPSYDTESTMILSSGRLTYQKGFDMLVDAAAQVLPKHPEWSWLILGEGEDRPQLEKKIAECGLEHQLILKGRVGNVDTYYRKAAMFVLTSRFEGLPMVLLEAKAHALPLISFDCPTGPSEIISNEINGTIVPTNNTQELADAVNDLIEDEDKRIAYSRNSNVGTEKYGMSPILCSWEKLLNGIFK